MRGVPSKMTMWGATVWVLAALLSLPALAQSQTAPTNDHATSTTAKKKKTKKDQGTAAQPGAAQDASSSTSAAGGGASASDIARAKSGGKVWVNLDSGIYHKSGRWYGKTKNGKFMTEQEAKAAGYKAAKKE